MALIPMDSEDIRTDFTFNGTPDSDKAILTNVPFDSWMPIREVPASLTRGGWKYGFYVDTNKNSTYWYIYITEGTPSGTFSGRIAAKRI